MVEVVFSHRAAQDIDEIYDWTEANWGPSQAESYFGEIRTICEKLRRRLYPGRQASDVRPGHFTRP